ncbi:MAG: helix-turn-helix transcriptional regulator [Proteocatella sp.]
MLILEEFIHRLVPNLASFLGINCEVVFHDFTKGYDQTVVLIENGHVTNRKVSNCPTSLLFEKFNNNLMEDSPLYFNTTKDGHIIKSCSTMIRDESGKIVGALCMNMDITDLVMAQNTINAHTMYDSRAQGSVVFANDVQELLEMYLSQCEGNFGKTGALMSKEEKIRALAFLDSKGVFMISKASVRLCSFFNISKYTLYSYLEEARLTLGENPDNIKSF